MEANKHIKASVMPIALLREAAKLNIQAGVKEIRITNICEVPKEMYTITWDLEKIKQELLTGKGGVPGLKITFQNDASMGI